MISGGPTDGMASSPAREVEMPPESIVRVGIGTQIQMTMTPDPKNKIMRMLALSVDAAHTGDSEATVYSLVEHLEALKTSIASDHIEPRVPRASSV